MKEKDATAKSAPEPLKGSKISFNHSKQIIFFLLPLLRFVFTDKLNLCLIIHKP
jgi:hypothetical protein